MNYFKSLALAYLVLMCNSATLAQPTPDAVYSSNIRSVRFHVYGDQESLPVYKLNSGDKMELHFDDMDTRVKNFYYTYQLCDYNWVPVNISTFDYVKGFTQQRITNYRFSTVSFSRYVHYQAMLPDNNSAPSRSGNYLLKVFLDGDTSKTVFTRALLVLDVKSSVSAQVVQPFAPQHYKSHQRIRCSVNLQGVNSFDANRQVKLVVLQNRRWDNAQGAGILPTFVRQNTLEYNTENSLVFPGGKEWRWLDLRSFRLLGDRIDHSANTKTTFELFVKPDGERTGDRYVFYKDLNGMWLNTTYETVNPYWQADYARVHFCFVPPNQVPYAGKELYLTGQFVDYRLTDSTRMLFNDEKKVYEGTQLMKQGYYDYGYLLADKNNPAQRTELEGNYWETENVYTILVYYKAFTDQSDQLIGVASVNTRIDRPGFSF